MRRRNAANINRREVTITNTYAALHHRVPSQPMYEELQRNNSGGTVVQSEASSPAKDGGKGTVAPNIGRQQPSSPAPRVPSLYPETEDDTTAATNFSRRQYVNIAPRTH